MKKLAIIFISLGLLVACSCNNERGNLSTDVVTNPNTAEGKSNDGLPVIEFEKEIHDFGKLVQGEKATFNFRFKNNGDKDLVISQVKSSCGCTVPKYPKEPVKPGDEGVLKVTFDSEGRKGVQNKVITVVHNGQPNQTFVRIKAMVIVP
ncbi:MAG: DUF1573 domain-containing protein [Bacteroidales bacterium]|nr:DUF1573 domain-containing protein [Bacteroidales bacterium]MCF8404673.1 DUF1573 domain-containing protein [Bacteroidales bacterium]